MSKILGLPQQVPIEDVVAALKALAHDRVSVTWYLWPGALEKFPNFIYGLRGQGYGVYTEDFPFFHEDSKLADRRIKLRSFPRTHRPEDTKHHGDLVLASTHVNVVQVIKDRWGLFPRDEREQGEQTNDFIEEFTTSSGTSVSFSLTEEGQFHMVALSDGQGNEVFWTVDNFDLNGGELARDMVRMLHDPSLIAQAAAVPTPPEERPPFTFGIPALDSFFSDFEEGSLIQVIASEEVAGQFFCRVGKANAGWLSEFKNPRDLRGRGRGPGDFYTTNLYWASAIRHPSAHGKGRIFFRSSDAGGTIYPDPDADYVFHIQSSEVRDESQRTLTAHYTVTLLRSPDGSSAVFRYDERLV